MRGLEMNLDVALVFAISGIVGSILVTQLWQMNWIKRETFKMQKTNVMAQNRIKLKKLEKELGLSKSKEPNLDLSKLLDQISGDQESGIPDSIEGLISHFAENNPDLVANLAQKYLGSKAEDGQSYES